MNILLLIILAPLGFFIPISWIIRLWLGDRMISYPLALTGIFAHLAIFVYAIILSPAALLIYCGLILAAIAFSPILSHHSDHRQRRQMALEDIEKYERLIERHPENAALHAALANAYMECGRYDDAIPEYEKTIELDAERTYWEQKSLVRAREEKARQAQRWSDRLPSLFKRG